MKVKELKEIIEDVGNDAEVFVSIYDEEEDCWVKVTGTCHEHPLEFLLLIPEKG